MPAMTAGGGAAIPKKSSAVMRTKRKRSLSKRNKNKSPQEEETERWIRRGIVIGGSFFLGVLTILAWYLPRPHRQRQGSSDMILPMTTTTKTHNNKDAIGSLLLPHPPPAQQRRRQALAGNNVNPNYRLALLLPFTGTGPESIPAYLPLFCQGAQSAADVADFFLIHNGVLDDPAVLDLTKYCRNNVYLINLHSTQAMADRLVQILDLTKPGGGEDETGEHDHDNGKESAGHHDHHHKKKHSWKLSRQRLRAILTAHLQTFPYTLVEYKPALGYIFEELIVSPQLQQQPHEDDQDIPYTDQYYTHWGYTDLDMIYGDLGRHVEDTEWRDYQIVTWGFGDQERLYIKGQFTMHQNTYASRRLWWQDCEYLSKLDERWHDLLFSSNDQDDNDNSNGFRLESAEGCYSAVLMQRTDIAIKFAVKAWTDVSTTDLVHAQGLYLFPQKHDSSNNNSNNKHVLVKAVPPKGYDASEDDDYDDDDDKGKGSNSISLLNFLSPDWFLTDAVYQNKNQPFQVPMGAMEALPLPIETYHKQQHKKQPHCMFWVQSKYQKYLCLRQGGGAEDDEVETEQQPISVSSQENVFLVQGKLYKQAFATVALPSFQKHSSKQQQQQQLHGTDFTDTSEVVAATGPFFHFQEWKRRYRINQLMTLMMMTTTDAVDPVLHNNEKKNADKSSSSSYHSQPKKDSSSSSNAAADAVQILLPEGAMAVPLPSSTQQGASVNQKQRKSSTSSSLFSTVIPSPLGIDLHDWMACPQDDRSQLPSQSYCLSGCKMDNKHFANTPTNTKDSQFKMPCQYALSWKNQHEIEILSAAPGWNPRHRRRRQQPFWNAAASSKDSTPPPVNVHTGITLIQTIQMHAAMGSKAGSYLLTRTLRNNLQRWNGQPGVVLIQISPWLIVNGGESSTNAVQDVKEFIASLDSTILETTFIALVKSPVTNGPHRRGNEYNDLDFLLKHSDNDKDKIETQGAIPKLQQDDWIISEKTLQNMAMDIVPTRWYVTGLSLDGGQQIQISPDLVELAQEKSMVAVNQGPVGGGGGGYNNNLYWIPTFAHSQHQTKQTLGGYDGGNNDEEESFWSLSNWLLDNDDDGKEEDEIASSNSKDDDGQNEKGKKRLSLKPPILFRGGNSMELCNDHPVPSDTKKERHNDDEGDDDDDDDDSDFLSVANRIWWEQTFELLHQILSSSSKQQQFDKSGGDGDDRVVQDDKGDTRVREYAQRLENLEYKLVSHLFKGGSHGGVNNKFQSLPYTLPVLLVDNLFAPTIGSDAFDGKRPDDSSSSSFRGIGHYQKTHLISREVEEFGGGGHEGCFPLLRLAQLVLFGYKLNVLEGAFTVDTTPYNHDKTGKTGGHPDEDDTVLDEQTERFRRHRRNVLCAANCVYLDGHGKDDLRDQIFQHEVLRAVQARTLWKRAVTQ